MTSRDLKQSRSWAAPLGAAHDAITQLGFYISGLCLLIIVGSYCYEIAARYFFSAPTRWAGAMVAYMLCAMLFLVTPELARNRGHILISILPDTLPSNIAEIYMRIIYLLSAVVCMVVGWLCFGVALSQFHSGINTVNEWRIPKWYLSALIPYALFSSGIYFMRFAFSKQRAHEASTEGVLS